MTRSPDSLIPSAEEQSSVEKWDDKASNDRMGGEANARAATQVNAVSAPSTPPASTPIQLEFFPGRACLLKAKPATSRKQARRRPTGRDDVEGGGTRRKRNKITGETLFGPAEEFYYGTESDGREAYKGSPRNRSNDAEQGVGGGHSTDETRDNRVEERTATSTKRTKRGKDRYFHQAYKARKGCRTAPEREGFIPAEDATAETASAYGPSPQIAEDAISSGQIAT